MTLHNPAALIRKALVILLFSMAGWSLQAQVTLQDSLALVDFYNATNGVSWSVNTNWLNGPVGSWYGVNVKGGRVSRLILPNNNLTGTVPVSFTTLDSLLSFNINNNKVTRLPALGNTAVDTLKVNSNKLTFRDLQPNVGIAALYTYIPQDSFDIGFDTLVLEQSTFVMSVSIDTEAGIFNQYQWFKNGDSIPGANARSYSLLCFDSSMQGTYTCRVRNNVVNGLTLYRRAIQVLFKRLANAGADIAVCDSTTGLLGNTPLIGTGTWALLSGNGSIANPTAPATVVSNLAAGPNVFRWTISNNTLCPASNDYITVTRDVPPSLPNASVDQEICQTSTQLNGNSPSIGTGTWTVISGSGVVAQPTSPNSVVNGLSQGDNIFRWRITNGSCQPALFDEVKVFVADTLQSANAGSSIFICPTDTALAAVLPLHTVGSWSLISGTGILANDTSPVSAVSGLSEGANVFRWTLTNACAQPVSNDVTITVYPFLHVDLGPDVTTYYSPVHPYILAENLPVAIGGNGQYTYRWLPAGNLNSDTVQHPGFIMPGTGGYDFAVTVTDGHLCTATDDLHVEVNKFEVLEVPTLITPNGDGLNDVLYAPGVESYADNQMEIYDRNGQLVFSKKGYLNEFDGTSTEGPIRNGGKLAPDTYYYVLKLDNDKIQKGFFELKR